MAELEQAEGPLTFLEVLAALAPDQPPRPELVKAHAVQAQSMRGDGTAQVKQGLASAERRLQAGTAPTTASRQPCTDMRSSSDKSGRSLQMPTSKGALRFLCASTGTPISGSSMGVLGMCDIPTSSGLVWGACVESGNASMLFQAYHKFGNNGGFTVHRSASVRPGHYVRVEMAGVSGSTKHRGAVVGSAISGQPTLGTARIYTALR